MCVQTPNSKSGKKLGLESPVEWVNSDKKKKKQRERVKAQYANSRISFKEKKSKEKKPKKVVLLTVFSQKKKRGQKS